MGLQEEDRKRRGNSLRQIFVLALSALLAAPLTFFFGLTVSPTSVDAQTASQQLPDLGMARLTNLSIDTNTVRGRKVLRFDATIKNVGAGPFEVQGKRDSTSGSWSVTQRIYNSTTPTGAPTEVSTPATLVFGGDGHNHWHVNNLQDYLLDRLDNGQNVGTGAKMGFCFYDNVRGSSTQDAYYTTSNACAGGQQSLQVLMGLSVGWGDLYSRTLRDQYIDITGLAPGRYKLRAVADKDRWFTESDRSNNETWVDIQINSGKGVKVLRYGPSV